MFNKVLVAVGGQDASFEPVLVAARLAAQLSAGLTILSVKRSTAEALGDPYYTDLQSERIGETQATLAKARRMAEAEGAHIDDVDLLDGAPAELIVSHAKAGRFGVIVMGKRRHGRLHTALLGSVTAEVAAHSHVPVMIVPEPAQGDAPDETE